LTYLIVSAMTAAANACDVGSDDIALFQATIQQPLRSTLKRSNETRPMPSSTVTALRATLN